MKELISGKKNNSWRQDSALIEYLVMIQALCCDICPALPYIIHKQAWGAQSLSDRRSSTAYIIAHAGLHIWGEKSLDAVTNNLRVHHGNKNPVLE